MTPRGLAACWGLTPDGIGAAVVAVEAHVARGLPSLGVIGLPGASIGEARWRVRSAVANTGLAWPEGRITVGLSPADLPKNGTGLDLAIAVAVLAADGRAPVPPGGTAIVGELALDGEVRPVRSILAMALQAQAAGLRRLVLPEANASAAAMVPGLEVAGVTSLRHALDVLSGDAVPVVPTPVAPGPSVIGPDLADVRGQAAARFAMEVLAAGGHHGLLIGDAGSGKTMLAERVPGIMPPLTLQEALEITAIHASTRSGPRTDAVMTERPFIAPHHSASVAALIGGVRGSVVQPGAVTLAHHGVLFMDEAPEFARPALESLREPMESGSISLARASGAVRLPAACQVLMAANDCPCGLVTGSAEGCRCTAVARRRYRERLSGPLLDRVDLRVSLVRPPLADMRSDLPDPTEIVRARVRAARDRMLARAGRVNALVPAARLHADMQPDAAALRMLDRMTSEGPRGRHRIVRIGWTLADLAGRERPGVEEMHQAIALRSGDAG